MTLDQVTPPGLAVVGIDDPFLTLPRHFTWFDLSVLVSYFSVLIMFSI
jgi:hypothetical protein